METHFTGRLGVAWLRPEDRILIKTMLQLQSLRHGVSFAKPRWNLVTDAPFDAVVGDSLLLPSGPDAGRALSCPVLRIVPYGTDAEDADSIARPLTAETLYVWVSRVWETCAVASGVAPSVASPEKEAAGQPPILSRAAGNPAVAPVVKSSSPVEPSSKPVSPIAVGAQNSNNPHLAMAAAEEKQEQSAYYKLKRWPPVHLLQNDALNIRMASLLSRHPLQVRDLEWLTGVELGRCQHFVDSLLEAGLLILHQNAAEPSMDSQVAASRISAATTPSFSQSSRHSVTKEASAFLQKSLQDRGVAPAAGAVSAPLVSPSQGQGDVSLEERRLQGASVSGMAAESGIPNAYSSADHRAPPDASPKSFFRRGLIGSIRKKLGI